MAAHSVGVERPPRWTRWFVGLFLTAFVVCGTVGIEAWPLSGFRLFSHLRSPHLTTWQAFAVAGGHETQVAFSRLPAGDRGFTLLMKSFASLPTDRRQATCRTWAGEVRSLQPLESLRLYRLDWDLVRRAGDRPADPPVRTLMYECHASG